MRQAGFTLTELVVVILIAGILGAVAVPRLLDSSDIDQAGAVSEVKAALQYARKTSIYSRRHVCVSVAGNQLSLTRDPVLPESVTTPNCSQTLDLPVSRAGCAKNAVCPPAGVSIGMAPASFIFSAGRGAASVAAIVTIAGVPVTVDATTGIAQ
jgi:prepilin-type N-terminal cleavage/methylation domain-containing protein